MGAADARPELAERDDLRPVRTVGSLERRLERLPDSHPASPRYVRENRAPAEPDFRPLTDAEHADHVKAVERCLADAHVAKLDTYKTHTIDDNHDVWSYDRRLVHDSLIESLYARAANVPSDHEAIVTGGLAGSGKTTVLTEHAGIDLSNYMMINPDLIKEEMATRGLVPEIHGLTPMEASELVHEESSHVAKRLAHRAQADGKNVIWDITMSRVESAEQRIESLRASGYTKIEGIFVDIPVDVSLRRADSRHREGHDEYRTGSGLGGRFVPKDMIQAQADDHWGSKNRAHFEAVKHRFTGWALYDNSVDGRAPVLVERSNEDHLEAG
jgi:predicted kinase